MSASLTTRSFAPPAKAVKPRVSALTAFVMMAVFSAALWFGIAQALQWAMTQV